MTTTPHLAITLIEQAQAQKEVTMNDALMRMDAILNGGAIAAHLATPPTSPSRGDMYIVATSPTGAWAGHATHMAYFDQLWRFITPRTGCLLWVNDVAELRVFTGTNWVTIVEL
jgi:hypothetical protein